MDGFLDNDAMQISWTVNLKQELAKDQKFELDVSSITPSLYRPFTKQWVYYNRRFNERMYQMPRLFPDAAVENRAIMVKGNWRGDGQISLMINSVACLQPDGGAQCFPLYLYEKSDEGDQVPPSDKTGDLFAAKPVANDKSDPPYIRKDGISNSGLKHFQDAYPKEKISKEDLFYYIYGLLHSLDYRKRYADNPSKELPRIPCVKSAPDFWAFSKAGRALAGLHLNYESVTPYPVKIVGGDVSLKTFVDADFRVTKMKFVKKGDKTAVVYNHKITMTDIPVEAYEYVVNGKSALEWVMERQAVTTHKDSGIVNDANGWAIQTMGDPKYPLELFQRVITVSLETMKIVRGLPKLEIATMDVMVETSWTIETIRSGIRQHWGDAPAACWAIRIIDAMAEKKVSENETLRVSDILKLLDTSELSSEIIAALAILAQSELAIFESGGEFVDETSGRHSLSPEDFQRVLNLDTVVHPSTKEEVSKASHKVVPVFDIATNLFESKAR